MQAKPIKLTVDNQTISIKLYKPKESSKKLAFLFLHGWTGKPNEKAAALMAEQGFYCLTISMRGHNDSEGDIRSISAQDSLQDAVVSYDFLKQEIPKCSSIVAVGNSYGSYIATLLSELRNLAGLSLRVPAAYPDSGLSLPKWGKGHDDPEVDAWRKKPTPFSDNKAFSLLHSFTGHIQIIEAENDEMIPSQTVKNYVNAVAESKKLEYKLMKNWPHSIGDNQQIQKAFETVLLNWANKLELEV